MTTLIVDFSPILYSNFISASTEMKKNGLKPNAAGKLDLSTVGYKEIIQFKILEELSKMKTQFRADEIVIAVDNPKGGYWRKDIYAIYKGKRKEKREKSDLDWDGAFELFEIIKMHISKNTSFKLIDIEKTEGDDCMFILSEYLSRQNHKVILHSLDHDTVYNLKNPGVKWWRHVKTAHQPGEYKEVSPGEILELEIKHLIQGDNGDNIKNVKSFSRFSKKFKEIYPKKKEIDVYDKRFKLDEIFTNTYGESAYNQPRYGAKTFMKSNKTIEDLLSENPIYEKNYMMNRKIALPEGIPTEISAKIIEAYNTVPTEINIPELQKYFTSSGSFELLGIVGAF